MMTMRPRNTSNSVVYFKSITGTDFAFWDTWLYTPLCLVIGLRALWLASTPRAR